jgi:hypothetical protein
MRCPVKGKGRLPPTRTAGLADTYRIDNQVHIF